MEKRLDINKISLIALFSALIIAGTFIKITVVPPVPITLQTFFIYLSAILLGPWLSTISVFVYLILGLSGLPVFTAGGGPAALIGPTGGFLMSMLPATIVIGLICNLSKEKFNIVLGILALLVGTLIIYLGGVLWFSHVTEHDIAQSLKYTCYPFLIGDTIKIVFALLIGKTFWSRIKERLQK